MRTVIIDDEKRSIDLIIWLTDQYYPDLKIVGTFTDARIAHSNLEAFAPELIFLDISMPFITGFGIAKKLLLNKAKIIFITAFHGPLIKHMQHYQMPILLKPIDPEDFIHIVNQTKSNPMPEISYAVFDELNQWV